MSKCENCNKCIEGRIRYINMKKTCDSCYSKIKKKNDRERKGLIKCNFPGCSKYTSKKNKCGYCLNHKGNGKNGN